MEIQNEQAFKDLLSEGLLNLEIRNVDKLKLPLEELDVYKNTLKRRWEYPYLDLGYNRNPLSQYYPYIIDDNIRNKLVDFIKLNISKHIDDDSIELATFFLSGASIISDYSSNDLLTQLLNIAIVYDIEEAVSRFQECIVNNIGLFLYVALIDGIKIEGQKKIDEGVYLIPIPHDRSKIPIYMKNIEHVDNLQNLFGKTLLVTEASIYPALFNSFVSKDNIKFEDLLNEVLSKVQIETKTLLFPKIDMNINYNLFCQSLSLVCNSSIQIYAHWKFVSEDQLFNLKSINSNTSSAFPVEYVHHSFQSQCSIDDSHIMQSIDICNKLINFKSSQEKLHISINRWIKSKAVKNPVDRMIELGIAFESIGLAESTRNTEIRYKLGVHISRLLGKDKEDRIKLMKTVKKMYDWRSACVHTGKFPKSVKLNDVEIESRITEFQNLCRKCILKIIENGKSIIWSDLIHE